MIYTIEEIKEKATPLLMHTALKVWVFLIHMLAAIQQNKVILTFLLIEEKIRNLLDYVDLVRDLEDIFHYHTDVVTTGIKDKSFYQSFQIYENGNNINIKNSIIKNKKIVQ